MIPVKRPKNKVILVNRQKKFPVSANVIGLIRRAVRVSAEFETLPYPAEVSVTLVDDAKIHEMNQKFRGVDRPTDVLSFPLFDEEPNAEGRVMLGDIVISLERAAEQAKEIGNSFEREVAFLVIHSTLHLLGYDHERSEDDEEAQCLAQREIIETLKIG